MFARDSPFVFTCYITFVVGQNIIQVKMISTEFDSEFPLSSSPKYSLHFLPTTHICSPCGHQELFKTMQTLTTHLLNLNEQQTSSHLYPFL